MGQIIPCIRRKQLDKFLDEEPKPPRSPIVIPPPDRETIYIAYVVLAPCPPRVLIIHIKGHGVHWQWQDDGMSFG